MKHRRRKSAILPLFLLTIVVCAVLVTGFFIAYANAKPEADKICDGIFIDNIDLSGMTAEQANEAVDAFVADLASRKVIINVEGSQVTTTLKKLGFTCEENDYIDKALSMGKTGNVIKRFKEIKDLENQKLSYELSFTVDEKKVTKFVKNKCEEFTVKAKNASLKRTNGTFVITPEQKGKRVEAEATIEQIINKAIENKEMSDIAVDAVIVDDIPKYKKADLERCTSKLGGFSTAVSGTEDRVKNVQHATSFINGTVLYPGETFSTADTIYPLTSANGYRDAPSYLAGQVVDSLGGGVCQVSTTLYNAVIQSELEVVERFPHSMIVSYVKPAMDAAIAGDYKDLKFKNNTDSPIYIEGFTQGNSLIFNIYGNETRDKNRSITFDSEILQRIEPGGEKVTVDKSMPITYRKVTQAAHIGYRANLWKIVYQNGKEQSREKVNYSTYKASPAYVTIGGKKEKEEDKDAKETLNPKTRNKPKSTKEPTSDQATNKATATPEVTPITTAPPVEVIPDGENQAATE